MQQLQNRPYYLFLYLDALIEKDTHLVSEFADLQVSILLSHSPGGLGCSGEIVRGVRHFEID